MVEGVSAHGRAGLDGLQLISDQTILGLKLETPPRSNPSTAKATAKPHPQIPPGMVIPCPSEEILPHVPSQPPLVQPEAVSSPDLH